MVVVAESVELVFSNSSRIDKQVEMTKCSHHLQNLIRG